MSINERKRAQILTRKLESPLIPMPNQPAQGEERYSERALGAIQTPKEVVDYMVKLAPISARNSMAILEPACDLCPFLSAISEKRSAQRNEDILVGVEVSPQVVSHAQHKYPEFRIIHSDFLLWDTHMRFDITIGNPPYGIIGDPSHYPISAFRETKRLYRKLFATWHGKYNIYGAFIEKAVNLLKKDGTLVFIVPGTFMVLDDFIKLRQFLARNGRIKIHYLGSVFQGRNVVAVVLVLEKGKRGLEVWESNTLLYRKDEFKGEIIRFESPMASEFEKGKVPLGKLFKIHFAARSPQIKAHPLAKKEPGPGLVPVLTGRNLKTGFIDYEHCYSGYWFPHSDASSLRSFYGFSHIVVAHTKGSKVVAAVDERCYPWREEFHLVPLRKDINIQAVVDYLNSNAVQEYVAGLYRDISPHLTATMLKQLPVPEKVVIKEELLMSPGLYEEKVEGAKSIFAEHLRESPDIPPCNLLRVYENFLSNIDLEFYREKYVQIKTVEQDLPRLMNPLPPIYNAYWQRSEYLSFEEFFAYYWDSRPKEIMDFIKQFFWGCSIEFVRLGLEARLYRTWVSLLTQFHLGYLWNCLYSGAYNASAGLDMEGIDAVITVRGKKVATQIKKISYRREASQRRFSKKKLAGFAGSIEIPYTVEDPADIENKKRRAKSTRSIAEAQQVLALASAQHYLPNGFVIFTKDYATHLNALLTQALQSAPPASAPFEITYQQVLSSMVKT